MWSPSHSATMPKTIYRPEYLVLRRLIRQARDDAGVTQTAVSLQLGRSQSFISDIERGVRRIDALELRDLCQLLGRDWAEFLAELEAEIAKLPAGRRRVARAPGTTARKRTS